MNTLDFHGLALLAFIYTLLLVALVVVELGLSHRYRKDARRLDALAHLARVDTPMGQVWVLPVHAMGVREAIDNLEKEKTK